MDLNESVFNKLDVGHNKFKRHFQTLHFYVVVKRSSVNLVAIINVVHRKTLNQSQASMILIHAKDFHQLFLPSFGSHCASLQLILKFLGSQNAQSLNNCFFASFRDWRILLLNLLCVEDFCQSVADYLYSCFESLHVSISPGKLDVV